jgi:hypothetical protein
VDDERVTVAVLTTRVTDAFTALNAHTHDGSGGDGSANITPSSVLFTDQSDLDAPASGKTVLWSNAGKLHQRTNGGAAQEMDVVGHTHTLRQISEAGDHGQDTESEDDFSDTTALTDTYADTGMTVTMTPASAKNAIVVTYGVIFYNRTNSSTEAGPVTYSLRLLVGGVQKEEVTCTIQSDDGSDAWYEAVRGAFTYVDGAASSTIFKTQAKSHVSSGGGHVHLVMDKSKYLHVVEVSV